MLSLSVRSGDYIMIGSDIVVQILKTGDVTRVAIDAPRDIPVERSKFVEQRGQTPDCIQRVREKPLHGQTRFKRP